MARAGSVVDLHPRPAELVDPAIAPDPDGVVERAMTAAVLLRDQHDRERLEPQRHVEPPEAEVIAVRRPSRRLGLADRADTPRAIPAAEPRVRRDLRLGAVDDERPGPCAELGEPPGVDDRAPALAHQVPLLVDRGERPLPGQVEA